MKERYIFNIKPIHQNTHSLRISLNITQTSIIFFAETTIAKESKEDFASNNQKQMKTATKTTKAKHNKKMATMKEKAHYNKIHYYRCQTKATATVYREMTQEKKYIVEEMGFGALTNIQKLNVSNTLLKELPDQFDEEKGCLKTLQGRLYITHRVAAALGITNGGNLFLEKVDYNNLNPTDKECAGYECRRGGEPEKIQEDFCCLHTKGLLAPHNSKCGLPNPQATNLSCGQHLEMGLDKACAQVLDERS
ncbi:hypothetical protein Ahy_Scaffold6g108075 [Arachis hypogaea]|uniref:Uncharacterized protein n=1 Tax=Arachis hypogaea TaxID=3818 RepID=A0A444WPA9_ARAHY|nr:hypothetical protein Ahy_Scaffold6g108075 [Arachis hypogaea]